MDICDLKATIEVDSNLDEIESQLDRIIDKLEKVDELQDNEIPQPWPGEDIKGSCERAVKARRKLNLDCDFNFNGIDMTVEADDNWKSLYWRWMYKFNKEYNARD